MAIIEGFVFLKVQPSYLKPLFPPHEILETAVEIKGGLNAVFVEDGNSLLVENGSVINREHELFHGNNGRRMSSFIQYERARKQGGFCKDFWKT